MLTGKIDMDARIMINNTPAPPATYSGELLNSLALQSMIPPELRTALRQAVQDPLGRLAPDDEHALAQLGLLRVWEDFIYVTELGRKVLEDEADRL